MQPKKYVKGKHLRTDWGHGVKEFRQIKEAPAPEPQPPLQVDLDERTAQGAYANLALITHGQTEFVLDFALSVPGRPKARTVTRIISSPKHAKRFAAALADNIRKYEARLGPIGPARPADKRS